MPLLTRNDLDQIKLKRKYVEVPDWGGTVLIRELTGEQRDSYEGSLFNNTAPTKGQPRRMNTQNARARLVAMCLIDEEGKRLYNDNEAYLLGQLGSQGVDLLFDECRKLSGITDEDNKEIEQAIKNLENGQNVNSGIS